MSTTRWGQLVAANVTNIDANDCVVQYSYRKDGNIDQIETITTANPGGSIDYFSYEGDLLTQVGPNEVGHDLNGNLVAGPAADYIYNHDNKLRSATAGNDSLTVHYDPDGNRIFASTIEAGVTTNRKYIVATINELPVVLMELDPNDNNAVVKSYVYANDQIIMQHTGDMTADRYFYLTDRLGSVRQLVDVNGDIRNVYTYGAFGQTYPAEDDEEVDNPYKFTGQRYDPLPRAYDLRDREYLLSTYRFSSHDSHRGDFNAPLTCHPYLYCLNDPTNRTDPTGEFSYGDTMSSMASHANMASNAYDIGSRFKSYAQMIVTGASLSNIMLTAAIDVGMDVAGGKLFDALAGAGSKLMRKLRSESHSIYRSVTPGKAYIGRTMDLDRRAKEHWRNKGIRIELMEGLDNLSYDDARAVEQALVERNGLGNLLNQRNSISPRNPRYSELIERGRWILELMGI